MVFQGLLIIFNYQFKFDMYLNRGYSRIVRLKHVWVVLYKINCLRSDDIALPKRGHREYTTPRTGWWLYTHIFYITRLRLLWQWTSTLRYDL